MQNEKKGKFAQSFLCAFSTVRQSADPLDFVSEFKGGFLFLPHLTNNINLECGLFA
jgi:hypothetical protein